MAETSGLAAIWARAGRFVAQHRICTSFVLLGGHLLANALDHPLFANVMDHPHVMFAGVLLAFPSREPPPPPERKEPTHEQPGLPRGHKFRAHPLHQALMALSPYGRLYEALLVMRETGIDGYQRWVERLPWNRATRRLLRDTQVDLQAWDKGSTPSTLLLPLESMTEMSGRLYKIWSDWFHVSVPTLPVPQQLFVQLARRLGLPVVWQPEHGVANFDTLLLTIVQDTDPAMAFLRLAHVIQDLLVRRGRTLQLQPAGLADRRVQVAQWRKDPLDTAFVNQYAPPTEEPHTDVRAYVPFYLADEACRFVVASCGGAHILSALLIAAKTDRGRALLVVDQLRAIPVFHQIPEEWQRLIIMEVLHYIVLGAKEAGFGEPVIEMNHLPNEIRSHPPTLPFREGCKIHPRNQPFFSLLFRQDTPRDPPRVTGDLAPVRDVIDYQRYRMHPLDYLYHSELKVYDEESMARGLPKGELERLRAAYPLAFHLLENKPVDATFVESFGRALQSRFSDPRDQETYCVVLQSLTSWDQAKKRMKRFIKRHDLPGLEASEPAPQPATNPHQLIQIVDRDDE